MPDISMCLAKSCPSFKKCYRAQAEPNGQWQSYGTFRLPRKGAKKCSAFIALYSYEEQSFPKSEHPHSVSQKRRLAAQGADLDNPQTWRNDHIVTSRRRTTHEH